MTIEFRSGDILQSEAESIVITVNCQGTMGKGLALQAKQKWPMMDAYYRKVCRAGKLGPGGILDWINTLDQVILLAATKDHWRDPSRLTWIDSILYHLRTYCQEEEVTSIAIPPLGAGLGGLHWPTVRSMIIEVFQDQPVHCIIYGKED